MNLSPITTITESTPPPRKESAISQWVNQYGDELYSWACLKLPDDELAQDLVQETFVAAFEAYDTFLGKSNPKTWLFAILKNKIADEYRKLAKTATSAGTTLERRATYVADHSFNENGSWKEKNLTLVWASENNPLDDPEFTKVMKQCMDSLPTSWNAMINARYLLEKNSNEICQELEISPTNYWQILHRAKLAMKKCIEIHWFNK